MLIELDFLREISVWTVLIRLFLAAVVGGVVGLERELHGRPAGLRTHMMVSLGAALTTMIGIFNIELQGVDWADPMRLGAQVISGIGFLGAGTILLKHGKQEITGLTTAAGLWTTAIIGLAIGAGFYEGGLVATALAVLIFTTASHIESLMNSKRQRLYVYIELDDVNAVKETMDVLRDRFLATESQVCQARSGIFNHVGVETTIKINKKQSRTETVDAIQELPHVLFAFRT